MFSEIFHYNPAITNQKVMTETLCKKYVLRAGNYCKPTLLTIFVYI